MRRSQRCWRCAGGIGPMKRLRGWNPFYMGKSRSLSYIETKDEGGKQDPMKKRLLYVVNDPRYFVTHRLPLAHRVVEEGYEVHIALPFETAALPASKDLELITSNQIKAHNIPLSRSGTNPYNEIKTIIHLNRIIREIQPDVIHGITIKAVLYSGILSLNRKQTAAVFAIPGLGHVFIANGLKAKLIRFLASNWYRLVFRNSRAIAIFQNEFDSEYFVRNRYLKSEQIILIPGCGVDIEKFHPSPKEPSEPIVVMLPARLQVDKGVQDFVDAAAILKNKGLQVRMVLVGYADFDRPGGVTEEQLKRWQNEYSVEWWGHSTNMPATLQKAHIICLPSHGGEGFPKVLIEAAACGLPIVTTNIPGCRDSVRKNQTALIVEPKNPIQLADALETFITAPELRARFGAAGRELVKQHYTEPMFINRSLEVYKRVLQLT
ncbi:MAG TPA: glycosyltransferase family 1 protein [Alphaproteobacteria bacterium]|nr:glycosyltransferase family 1 protein [Alphaproteobacteria bacterium]HBF97956.1 glycosyltransferase family 1 protein [Alphaproteobacteria bacterium]